MNISKVSTTLCTGCMACVYSCPINCITININDEGFYFPSIDIDKCVDCERCLTKCGANRVQNVNRKPLTVLSAYRLNSKLIMRSSSGGIASLIAEWVLTNGGVIYGAIMDSNMYVKHCRINSFDNIDALRGSKYVQSDFSLVYKTIIKDCESEKWVAVFGTPCQLYGVQQYLGKYYDNLILIDLICHGVPSPGLFDKYIDWKEKTMGDGKIMDYRFRDKGLYGWDTVYKISTSNRVETAEATQDPYYFAFIYAKTYRECCYKCCFSNIDRVGDVTLGDFWGVEEAQGVSAVLCNTETGRKIIENIADGMRGIETTIEKVVKKNSNLIKASVRPAIRDEFYKNVNKYGFGWAYRNMKFDLYYYQEKVKRKIPKRMKTRLKKILKSRG